MLKATKNSIQYIADRLGYLLMPKWRLPNLNLANHLRELFKLYEITCVFDVGANTGQYRRFLREEVGFKGLIVSIEPQKECFKEMLREAESDSAWTVLNTALGPSEESRKFNVMKSSFLSSFLEPNASAINNKIQQSISMQMRTLDSVAAEITASRPIGPIYLKLDTQGFDLEVMKGASSTLKSIRALQSEVSVLPLYEDMTPWHDAIQKFGEYGFTVSGLWPVTRTPRLEVIEFDCVMVTRL